jgi:hypothetical protein
MANKKITELTALTTPASTDVLAIVDVAGAETKKITVANLIGGGGGGASVVTGGGRVQVSASYDNGAFCLGWGGALGFNYYIWSASIGTNPLPTSGDLGTPGTTQMVSLNLTTVTNCMFIAPSDGIVTTSIVQEFDGSSEVSSQVIRYMIWKADASLVTALEDGTGGSGFTATLVASAKLTVPSASQIVKPMTITSTNGVSVSAGDILFGSTVYDGTLTSNRYFATNISIYTT